MKNSKAQLESKRPLLFLVGLLFAFSVTLVSFEWRTPYKVPIIEKPSDGYLEEPIWIPVTLPEPQKQVVRPELPKPEPVTDQFVETENTPETASADPFIPEPITDIPTSGTRPTEPDVEDEDLKIWTIPAVMPSYCGGSAAMFQFLSNNLKYPEIPLRNGVSGTVYVQFVVGKDGKLRDAKVMRPIDPWLDAEALRVAKMLNCFTPGKQAGRNVDVYFTLPVKFAISG